MPLCPHKLRELHQLALNQMEKKENLTNDKPLSNMTLHSPTWIEAVHNQTMEETIEKSNIIPNVSSSGQSAGTQINESVLWNRLLTQSTNDTSIQSLAANDSSSEEVVVEQSSWILNELHLIKAVVLVIVVCILLLSTCKVVFQTFSKYSGGGKKYEQR